MACRGSERRTRMGSSPFASCSTAFKVPSEASQENSPDWWFLEWMTDDCPLRSTITYCTFSIISSSYIDVEQQRSVGTLLHHINKKRLPKQHIQQFTTDFFLCFFFFINVFRYKFCSRNESFIPYIACFESLHRLVFSRSLSLVIYLSSSPPFHALLKRILWIVFYVQSMYNKYWVSLKAPSVLLTHLSKLHSPPIHSSLHCLL